MNHRKVKDRELATILNTTQGRMTTIERCGRKTERILPLLLEDVPYRKNGVVSANPERVAPQKYHHPLLYRSLIARSGSFLHTEIHN